MIELIIIKRSFRFATLPTTYDNVIDRNNYVFTKKFAKLLLQGNIRIKKVCLLNVYPCPLLQWIG